MIVREKSPRYLAFTWQEFLAGIDALSNFLPQEAAFYGRKCIKNTTGTGYFVIGNDGIEHIMNEDSIILFYGNSYLCTATFNAVTFWEKYERVIFN